ncbi:hypothetical protein [Breoghania sp.]|uniref:hypothetical protein n=1 Tax=Breoghania sp. TaxID=2065378 RepID=UPI00263A1EF0|nr:hypothetical protein [Breoghania sp.]
MEVAIHASRNRRKSLEIGPDCRNIRQTCDAPMLSREQLTGRLPILPSLRLLCGRSEVAKSLCTHLKPRLAEAPADDYCPALFNRVNAAGKRQN